MTMGEGGAVYTATTSSRRSLASLRDWGRDCYCAGGEDNTCGKRFGQQFGTLPYGYDHKYVYSRFGYNLKVTDMQAAVGVRPARAARRLHRAPQGATTPRLARLLAPLSDLLAAQTAHPGQRAELVRPAAH